VITKTKAPVITIHPVLVDDERIERTKDVVRRGREVAPENWTRG